MKMTYLAVMVETRIGKGEDFVTKMRERSPYA